MSRLILSLLILCLFLTTSTIAQNEDTCDLTVLLDEMDAAVTVLPKLTDEGAMKALMQMESLMARTRAQCSGYLFTNEEEGLRPVIGPLDFPDGVWIAKVTTPDYFIMNLTILQGDCDGYGNEYMLLGIREGEAITGGEKVFTTSQDCQALLTVTESSDPWELQFTPVRLD